MKSTRDEMIALIIDASPVQLISLGLTPNLENSQRLERFTDTGTTLKEVHKTGLGSSAALITSLVASLLVHFRLVERGELFGTRFSGKALSLIHNASQYVHCLAQGKVGSGFDIASAVYGSHLYTRFDPSVINPLMASSRVCGSALSPSLRITKYSIGNFHQTPRTKLILGDVDAGSDTPSLVSKVLKWRIENSAEGSSPLFYLTVPYMQHHSEGIMGYYCLAERGVH